MTQSLKIGIIGDYNFTYNSHHATNLALDHSSEFLEIDLNYYWIKYNEFIKFRPVQFEEFDGFLIAPGPITNEFFLQGIIKELVSKKIPVLITGEGYRSFVDVLIQLYNLNTQQEKLISDNLLEGDHFEQISIIPDSKQLIQLYENHSNIELTSTRFSLYPNLIEQIQTRIADIEAYNQFEDPEIISLKNHPFFLACGFIPQISSTREIPHPLIYTFLKACIGVLNGSIKN